MTNKWWASHNQPVATQGGGQARGLEPHRCSTHRPPPTGLLGSRLELDCSWAPWKTGFLCCSHWNVRSLPGIQGLQSPQTGTKAVQWLWTRRQWHYQGAQNPIATHPRPQRRDNMEPTQMQPSAPQDLKRARVRLELPERLKAWDFSESKSFVIHSAALRHPWGISFWGRGAILHSARKILC